MNDEYGPWRPLERAEVVQLMAPLDVRWWFTGGHALEVHLGRSWREHDDIDVSIVRSDIGRLHRIEPEWEVYVAAAGVLRRWAGEPLRAQAHENNVWLRRAGGPWNVDVTIGDGDDERWSYRRDETLTLAWDRAVLHTRDGLAYLTPSLQLLFKSARVREKDDVDAVVVIPTLDPWSLGVLDVRLARGHAWRSMVAQFRRGVRADDVLAVLDVLARAGVHAWLDGGWGVDALLGAQTRLHADLDLALPTRQWAQAHAALAEAGFVPIRDDGAYNQVLLDSFGRLVDVHAFDDETTVVGDDGVERHGPDGLAYVAGGFGGVGSVAGRTVPCMTAEFQMWSHTGYDVDAEDFADVERLHRRFGIAIPNDYAAWLDSS